MSGSSLELKKLSTSLCEVFERNLVLSRLNNQWSDFLMHDRRRGSCATTFLHVPSAPGPRSIIIRGKNCFFVVLYNNDRITCITKIPNDLINREHCRADANPDTRFIQMYNTPTSCDPICVASRIRLILRHSAFYRFCSESDNPNRRPAKNWIGFSDFFDYFLANFSVLHSASYQDSQTTDSTRAHPYSQARQIFYC